MEDKKTTRVTSPSGTEENLASSEPPMQETKVKDNHNVAITTSDVSEEAIVSTVHSSSPSRRRVTVGALEDDAEAKNKLAASQHAASTVPGAVSTSPSQAAFSDFEAAVLAKGGNTGRRKQREKRTPPAPGGAAVPASSRPSTNHESILSHVESRLGSKIRNHTPNGNPANSSRRKRGKGRRGLRMSLSTTPDERQQSAEEVTDEGPADESLSPSMPSPSIPTADSPVSRTEPETTILIRGSDGARISQSRVGGHTAAASEEMPAHHDNGTHDIEATNIHAVVVSEPPLSALHVTAVPSKEEEDQLERHRFLRCVIVGVACFVLVATAVIVPLVLLIPDDVVSDPANPTARPSNFPSMSPSSAPTTDAFEQFLELVANYSTPESLLEPSSPQYQAALWAANDDELGDSIGVTRRLQRYFLACLYFATDGDGSWQECNRNSDDAVCKKGKPWLRGTEDECGPDEFDGWRGLKCDDDTRVVQIKFNIQNNDTMGLNGQVPLELSYLTELTYLSLAQNQLSGALPSFLGNLTNLEQLYLQENQFRGSIPTEFQKLSFLTQLDLDSNQLSGAIPLLHVASSLDLSSNQLTGFTEGGPAWENSELGTLKAADNMFDDRIWSQITTLKGLSALRLEQNERLAGPLPVDLFSLTLLTTLDLSSCSLTGTIPESISQLSLLANLYLDSNQLDGPIPLDGLEAIVSSLRRVELHENNLTGTISSTSVLCGRFNLTVDCLGDEKQVECACCSNCPRA